MTSGEGSREGRRFRSPHGRRAKLFTRVIRTQKVHSSCWPGAEGQARASKEHTDRGRAAALGGGQLQDTSRTWPRRGDGMLCTEAERQPRTGGFLLSVPRLFKFLYFLLKK